MNKKKITDYKVEVKNEKITIKPIKKRKNKLKYAK